MNYRLRRAIVALISTAVLLFVVLQAAPPTDHSAQQPTPTQQLTGGELATTALAELAIKGRAPKTDYSRTQFGDGWATVKGCDTRNIILNRDLQDVVTDDNCHVTKGTLQDPYTGKPILFSRGGESSSAIQIDHVVALSDAWQKGAQNLTKQQRIAMANDPLELLAVDGPANQEKSDGDAATWLPSNKSFRCQYVARQIAIKLKYSLWVTEAEHLAMTTILTSCPNERLIMQTT
jgi:hypothetical protein